WAFVASAYAQWYTLSLHDALPIFIGNSPLGVKKIKRIVHDTRFLPIGRVTNGPELKVAIYAPIIIQSEVRLGKNMQVVLSGRIRSHEHTSELQSRANLVCRLLLDR